MGCYNLNFDDFANDHQHLASTLKYLIIRKKLLSLEKAQLDSYFHVLSYKI